MFVTMATTWSTSNEDVVAGNVVFNSGIFIVAFQTLLEMCLKLKEGETMMNESEKEQNS